MPYPRSSRRIRRSRRARHATESCNKSNRLKPEIIDKYGQSPKVKQITAALGQRESKVHVRGLLGSALSFVIDPVFRESELPMLFILKDKEEAAYYLNDLEQ